MQRCVPNHKIEDPPTRLGTMREASHIWSPLDSVGKLKRVWRMGARFTATRSWGAGAGDGRRGARSGGALLRRWRCLSVVRHLALAAAPPAICLWWHSCGSTSWACDNHRNHERAARESALDFKRARDDTFWADLGAATATPPRVKLTRIRRVGPNSSKGIWPCHGCGFVMELRLAARVM
jgi:hypothetical protein